MSQENYIVTARKWRPLKFSEVAGQSHITTTLKNAISNNRLHHAYLFTGPRGVGKTTTARILARALNCENPQDYEPCNECDSCRNIIEGRSMTVIEIDGASNNSVDDVRKLRENAKYPPAHGDYKLYIIDEVHMLSKSAFNALLKILEEPPPHLVFAFATTEPQKVLPTILSRCQRYDFKRIEVSTVAERLRMIADKEGIKIDEESLVTIGKKADGSMRDGQSIFDQVVAFCGSDIKYTEMADALNLIDVEFFFQISDAIKQSDLSEIFNLTDKIVRRGYDLLECIGGLLEHYRNILSVKTTGNKDILESSESIKDRYHKETEDFEPADLIQILTQISEAEQALRTAPQPRVKFELTLVQLASMDSAVKIEELLAMLGGDVSENPVRPKEKKTLNENKADEDLPAIDDFREKEEEKPVQKEPIKEKKEDRIKEDETDYSASSEKTPQNDINEKKPQKKKESDHTKSSISDRWEEFILKHGTSANNLHTLRFTESINVEFISGKEINVVADNDFYYEAIYDAKDTLIDKLEEFYGWSIKVNLLKGDISKLIAKTMRSKSGSSNKERNQESSAKDVENVDELHPIEKAIVEQFDAKVLR